MEYSFHVLLATIGKDSIFDILVELKKQLQAQDYLTIVFDGPDLPNVEEVKIFTKHFKCTVNIIIEPENLGFWGHAIRNKHKNLVGDFIWHIDDDDTIPPDSIEIIRNHCKDTSKMYIFQMDNKGDILWKTHSITFCQISTQMGIIPTKINDLSTFQYYYGGDYNFYKEIEDKGFPIEYIDKVIYRHS
jgi:hypothetical protein